MLYRAEESTDSPSWLSQEEQGFGRETSEGRASPAGGMAQAETQVGKSGHIFTRQGVEGLALLIVTILLSNDCLPSIALSGLAPALRGGIKTIFIFDGDTETLRHSVSFRKLHNYWKQSLNSWPPWGLQVRPPALSLMFCWDGDPHSPCTVRVAAFALQCKGADAPKNPQPAKTDVCSLALQGRFQEALAQGMEMSLDRQVGGR